MISVGKLGKNKQDVFDPYPPFCLFGVWDSQGKLLCSAAPGVAVGPMEDHC